MAHFTMQDFAKRKDNDTERKEVSVMVDGVEYDFNISKITPTQIGKYNQVQTKRGLAAYFAEVMLNHVFDIETGELCFKKVDILSDTTCSSAEEFFEKKLPPGLLYGLAREINIFSDLKSTQEEIDYLKN